MGHDSGLDDLVYSIVGSAPHIEIGFKCSHDLSVNNYRRSLLELCKSTGSIRIMNGRLHSDKHMGEFTYESDMGKSVIDLLISKSFQSSEISKFKILPM